MTNCIIAQSGGPTSVINSSVVGLYNANKELKAYNKVFAGLNGIEGILNGNIIDLTSYSDEEINNLNGFVGIDKSIFISEQSNVVDADKLLKANQQFAVRKHARFCEYPKHRHDVWRTGSATEGCYVLLQTLAACYCHSVDARNHERYAYRHLIEVACYNRCYKI